MDFAEGECQHADTLLLHSCTLVFTYPITKALALAQVAPSKFRVPFPTLCRSVAVSLFFYVSVSSCLIPSDGPVFL